ncbi:hypothetical protein ARZXY2_4715 (plasmid) [Arthrobacter sp. ZXY-2]|nr:hypothetical protein ARZXY2_4715 [Arthrobacter sp. ZXY-2]
MVLCATIKKPLETAKEMGGSDRSRIIRLHTALGNSGHRSWQLLEAVDRTQAMDALRILANNLQLLPANRLKRD